MAKAIHVCFRNSKEFNLKLLIPKIEERLSPDNIFPNKSYVFSEPKSLSLIYNPSSTIYTNKLSFILGKCSNEESALKLGSAIPKGSFALFRVGEENSEISTDYAGSRTVWYYFDDKMFLASTSQRLIIAFLGNFKPNTKAIGWFLSTGTLGPGHSWDNRIKMLPPRSAILLDRKTWSLKPSEKPNFNFESNNSDKHRIKYYKSLTKEALKESVSSLNLDSSNWTLALSGGLDSRGLLYHLPKENLRTVTWGMSSSLYNKTSDAYVAKRLAASCQIDNYFAQTDYKPSSFPVIVNRFLCSGEGRIDHLAGYLDGLNLWSELSLSKRGIIRGYDAFGRKPPVTNSFQVRKTCNLNISTDYRNFNILPIDLQIADNDIPNDLKLSGKESLENWRDRLWLQHRTPITTAALEDIKLTYVEVINPLLSEPMVMSVQGLPSYLRNNKKIWRQIVSEMYPEIPFARREAVQEVGNILNLMDVKEYICDSLKDKNLDNFFDTDFINYVVDNYNDAGSEFHIYRRKLRRLIIAYMPKYVENTIRKKLNPDPISNQWLALRILLILKVKDMYKNDSMLLA